MLLYQPRRVPHHGCTYKHFSNWLPGKMFSPSPLKQLDLHAEYSARLDEAIAENGPTLASKLNISADPVTIKRHLLSDMPSELFHVRDKRLRASKQPGAPTAAYNRLLRAIYKPKIDFMKVSEALTHLPGASQSKQALYMDPVHFERLISESLADRQLCTLVVPLAEAAGLPTTARERAQLLLHLHASNQPWRDTFAKFWPSFMTSSDIGAWNLLLELSYRTRCSETMAKVSSHLDRPDRFTLMLRLKYDAGFKIHTAREVFADFRNRGFVVDTVVITLFINALLRSRRPENIAMAEAGRDHVLKPRNGTRVIKRNSNHLARDLKALDAVNSATGKRYGVPLAADAELLESFVNYYIATRHISAAIQGIQTMAKNGYYPRHLVLRLLGRSLNASQLEELFYLCCDFEVALPGFISDGLANQLVKAITASGESFETASSIVARNRLAGRAISPPVEGRQLLENAIP